MPTFLHDRSGFGTSREFTPEGFMRVPAKIARTGIQIYTAKELEAKDKDPKALIKVYRPPEEVFNNDSLASFANKPITNNHPPELLNAKNAKKYSVGMSGANVLKNGDFVDTFLIITDDTAIENVKAGKTELSNGYTSDIDWVAGVTPEGESYDAVQRNIRGNHIAIVDKGRAGYQCRISDQDKNQKPKIKMKTILIDGISFEVSDQAAQAVGKLQKRCDDAEKESAKMKAEAAANADELKKKKAEAKKKEDEAQAKLDEAKAQIPSSDQLDKMVADRAAFVASVKTIDSSVQIDGKSDLEIKKAVIASANPNLDLADKSTDYVNARFDAICDSVAGTESKDNSLADALTKQFGKSTNDNESVSESEAARKKMIADSKEAWRVK